MTNTDDMTLREAIDIVHRELSNAQTVAEDRLLSEMLKGKDISEVVDMMMRNGNVYNRRTLRFFRWFCKWIPIGIMLVHWLGIYDFASDGREHFVLNRATCTADIWAYFMLYLLPLVIILASRFFYLCWRYRIPFFYFFGVNAMHLCYWSPFTTHDMIMPHYCLIAMICMMYVYGFVDMFLRSKLGQKLF